MAAQRFRAGSILALAFCYGAALRPGDAGAAEFTIHAASSRLNFEATAVLASSAFAAEEQFPGGLVGRPFGALGSAEFLPSIAQLNAGDAFELQTLGDAAPALGGAPGVAAADLAARVTSNTPTPLPDFEGIALGTLQSLQMDVAVRDAGLTFPTSTVLDVDANGEFSLANVPLTVTATVDARGTAVLQSESPGNHLLMSSALRFLASDPDSPVESVSDSILQRRITATLADQVTLNETIVLAAADSTMRRVGSRWRLDVPVAFSLTQTIEQGLLDVEFFAAGAVVAFSDELLLPGDANLDGTVDLADFNLLKLAFGTTDLLSDFNGDLTVNLSDFNLLKANFGAQTPVPEPAGMWLAAGGVLAAVRRRRWKRFS